MPQSLEEMAQHVPPLADLVRPFPAWGGEPWRFRNGSRELLALLAAAA